MFGRFILLILSTRTGMAGSRFRADPAPIINNPTHICYKEPLFSQVGLRTKPPKMHKIKLRTLRNLSGD